MRCASFFLLAVAAILLWSCLPETTSAAPDKFTCDFCRSTGMPYRCTAPMTSPTCLTYTGDSECHPTNGCQCCRAKKAPGCTFCEPDEKVIEDDADLFSTHYD